MSKDRELPVRIIVRRRRHVHGHHGGAWKVAFADFMTAMFALFLVLWLVNQSSDVKSAIAGYFQDPLGRADEFGSSILPGDGAQASAVRVMDPADVLDMRRDRLNVVAQRLQERMAESADLSSIAKYVEMKLLDDGLQIELLEDSVGVFFESGSPRPSEAGNRLIRMIGAELGRLPNHLRIEGHTDARPYRSDRVYGNWELSADRANSARRLLVDGGVAPALVAEIRGMAERRPRVPEDPSAPQNRRIAITVLLDAPKPPATPAAETTAPAESPAPETPAASPAADAPGAETPDSGGGGTP